MNVENPIRMVRELKGAPLSILFALSIVQQRVSQAWLERSTGYTDKTIAQALGYLHEISLVDWTSAGWQLTGEAKQLPLPLQLEENVADEEVIAEENSDDSCQTRRISDPFIIINDSEVEEEEINNNNNLKRAGGRKNSDSEVFNALTRAGIVGKKRKLLAESEWVTVESVENWEAHLKREKGSDYKPGLLITYLESGAVAPEPVELDEWGQPRKDYRKGLIELGMNCGSCGFAWANCECEEEV